MNTHSMLLPDVQTPNAFCRELKLYDRQSFSRNEPSMGGIGIRIYFLEIRQEIIMNPPVSLWGGILVLL